MKTNRLLLFLSLTCAATALAVDPPPDGGYPNQNTAEGEEALFSQVTDSLGGNTAIGFNALFNNTFGTANTALGDHNIAVGSRAGQFLASGSNNIYIGNTGMSFESKVIRIGDKKTQRNTYVAGISGVTVADGVGVVIDSRGHLGTINSSRRFKDAIKPMDKSSEALLELKPVTFRYKKDLDPKAIPQFGLVAEDVAKVNPDLVARDNEGKPYSVRYEAVNAMLLNEFLKEHHKVEQLETTVAQQQKQIQALTEGIQKVSAQIEISRPFQQTINDNQ